MRAQATPATLARRRQLVGSLAAVPLVLMGCATRPAADLPASQVWSGRLALRVDSDPPQSFSAGFDLRGAPEAGELLLNSPLGNTVAQVRWSPLGAEMLLGSEVRRRTSLDELTTELSGTALPVTALFGWLRGESASAKGWTADLSQQASGRITARRSSPLPSAELRLLFQP